MATPCDTSCKRVQTDAGDILFLHVDWWTDDTFDLDVTDGITAWRAEKVTCPATALQRDTWLPKTKAAFGLYCSDSAFYYDIFQIDDRWEFRWYWLLDNQDVRGMGTALLKEIDHSDLIHRFLDAACEVSMKLHKTTMEHQKVQENTEALLENLREELKQAVNDRRSLYGRCTALITQKEQEIYAKERENEKKNQEIQELRAMIPGNVSAGDPYEDLTS